MFFVVSLCIMLCFFVLVWINRYNTCFLKICNFVQKIIKNPTCLRRGGAGWALGLCHPLFVWNLGGPLKPGALRPATQASENLVLHTSIWKFGLTHQHLKIWSYTWHISSVCLSDKHWQTLSKQGNYFWRMPQHNFPHSLWNIKCLYWQKSPCSWSRDFLPYSWIKIQGNYTHYSSVLYISA